MGRTFGQGIRSLCFKKNFAAGSAPGVSGGGYGRIPPGKRLRAPRPIARQTKVVAVSRPGRACAGEEA